MLYFLSDLFKKHVCVCSVHVFCLVTGSEEELNPVLMALKRSADRKMPSKSLEDIPSATSSEHKACVCLPWPPVWLKHAYAVFPYSFAKQCFCLTLLLTKQYGVCIVKLNSHLIWISFQFLVLLLKQHWYNKQTSSKNALSGMIWFWVVKMFSIVKIFGWNHSNSDELPLLVISGCLRGSN